jgi:hypothetical protein
LNSLISSSLMGISALPKDLVVRRGQSAALHLLNASDKSASGNACRPWPSSMIRRAKYHGIDTVRLLILGC